MPKFEDENYSHEGIHVLGSRRERAIAKFSNANNSLDHFDNFIKRKLDERGVRRAAGAAVLKTESQNEHRRSYVRHQNEMKSMKSIKMRSHKSKPILSGSKFLSISAGGEDSRNDQNSLSCDFDFDFEFDVTKVKSKPGDEDSFREIAMMMDSLDAMKLAGFTQTKTKAKAKTQTQTQTQTTSSHKIETVNKKIKAASPSQQESNNNVQEREVEVASALVQVPVAQAPSPSSIINDKTRKRLSAIHCKLAKMNQQLGRSVDTRMKEVRMNMDEKLDHVHGEFDTILIKRCGTVACTRNVKKLS